METRPTIGHAQFATKKDLELMAQQLRIDMQLEVLRMAQMALIFVSLMVAVVITISNVLT